MRIVQTRSNINFFGLKLRIIQMRFGPIREADLVVIRKRMKPVEVTDLCLDCILRFVYRRLVRAGLQQ